MIVGDCLWDSIYDIKLNNKFIRCHMLTRFSDLPSFGFKGYFLVRPCCGDTIEISLDAEVKEQECECLCPAFGTCEGEL
jgi:hypothetical protein